MQERSIMVLKPVHVMAVGVAGAATMFAATPALANPQTSGTFRISAAVPMACWVDHAVQADALGASEGRVTEGCNSASGYVVSASYRPLDGSERAHLIYGHRSLDLSALGQQEVHRENGPRIQQIAYRFDDVRLNAPLTLSLTIQPI